MHRSLFGVMDQTPMTHEVKDVHAERQNQQAREPVNNFQAPAGGQKNWEGVQGKA